MSLCCYHSCVCPGLLVASQQNIVVFQFLHGSLELIDFLCEEISSAAFIIFFPLSSRQSTHPTTVCRLILWYCGTNNTKWYNTREVTPVHSITWYSCIKSQEFHFNKCSVSNVDDSSCVQQSSQQLFRFLIYLHHFRSHGTLEIVIDQAWASPGANSTEYIYSFI